ncbi:hypothetical protein IC006_2142 [Sulfuracidifex tepidarius]|uniref:Uncharacterized protein n=1 Tax=Sulfuracidifex tepidarius TaxID=1294262 RepID=A0A510DXX5_9CREN|nr:hypothetical protein [Sulfuracidifex tepidarius]BBG24808.1 hypothetical protein IC006_2142 [Sulfuracidifex tepidarius]
MDIRVMNRAVTISSSVIYSVNIILSVALYSVLSYVGLPVTNIVERQVLISVPLMSALFNALILAMITMSLKYAEYYGIFKSGLAIAIYSGYIAAFSPPTYLVLFMGSIMALCVIQILLLYYYAMLQKLMFG